MLINLHLILKGFINLPHNILQFRLFQVKSNQREENKTSAPNTQSVLSALKEKR